MTLEIQDLAWELGQVQKCGEVKSFNWMRTPLLIIGSPTAIHRTYLTIVNHSTCTMYCELLKTTTVVYMLWSTHLTQVW
jgi:hypothetical protein